MASRASAFRDGNTARRPAESKAWKGPSRLIEAFILASGVSMSSLLLQRQYGTEYQIQLRLMTGFGQLFENSLNASVQHLPDGGSRETDSAAFGFSRKRLCARKDNVRSALNFGRRL